MTLARNVAPKPLRRLLQSHQVVRMAFVNKARHSTEWPVDQQRAQPKLGGTF